MKTLPRFLLLLMTSFAIPAHAMNDSEFTTLHSIYMKGINGSENDLKNAISHFEHLPSPAPYDIFINTYRGSLRTSMAQHVYMPWNKMGHVDAGSELMDNALDEITEIHETQTLAGTALDFRMKLVVAHTYFRFPRLLNRFQDAKDIVAELLESLQRTTANTEAKNSLYKLAAAIAEEDGDAEKKAEFLSKTE